MYVFAKLLYQQWNIYTWTHNFVPCIFVPSFVAQTIIIILVFAIKYCESIFSGRTLDMFPINVLWLNPMFDLVSSCTFKHLYV